MSMPHVYTACLHTLQLGSTSWRGCATCLYTCLYARLCTCLYTSLRGMCLQLGSTSWLGCADCTTTSSSRPRAFFFQYLGACRRRTPRSRVDLEAPKDASHPRPFRRYPPIRSGPRCSTSACAEKSSKIDPHSGRQVLSRAAGRTAGMCV